MKKSVLFVLVVVVTSLCSGQWLERQVPTGDTFGGISLSGGLVANPLSGNVYIESHPVQVFSPSIMEKLRNPGASGKVVFCPPSGKGFVVRETLLTINAAADTVIGRTVLPFAPSLYAYSRTSNRLYLGAYGQNLLVFDPEGDSVVKTVPVSFPIDALLWDSVWNRLYIGLEPDTGFRLGVLDCAGDTLLPGIPTGIEEVSSLTLSPASHKLFCAGVDTNDAGEIVVINTDSLRFVGTVPGVPQIDLVAYSPTTDRLYVGDEYDDGVCIIDCRGDTIRTRRDIGLDVSVIAASSLTGNVYLGSFDSSRVLVMDTTDSVIGSVQPPAAHTDDVEAFAFRPDRNQLYGVTEGSVVFTIDASADTVAGSVSYAAVTATKMLHNPAGNKLYVFCGGQVLVMDSTFGTPKHIPGGAMSSRAVPVLYQALNRMYVADGNYLRVIDCNSDSLVRSRYVGLSNPLPVIVPDLNKLYIFSGGMADSVYAYDCLRDTLIPVLDLTQSVPCAVFDSRSNRIFFSCQDTPDVRALDPVRGTVTATFTFGSGSRLGRMAVNADLGRLYYTDQRLNRMYTIDVLDDSVIASESLPWRIDTMFLNRQLGRLYLCSQDTARVLVFDCNQGTVVDTIHAGYRYAGLMDDRNDKLYLRYGAVVDCRYDSVVARLDSINPRCMEWDAIDNRVFQAANSRVYVYRDSLTGVEESKPVSLKPMLTVLGNPARNAARLKLQIPKGQIGSLTLHDVAGRLVRSQSVARSGVFDLDLRTLPAGVYFVRLKTGMDDATVKVVVER